MLELSQNRTDSRQTWVFVSSLPRYIVRASMRALCLSVRTVLGLLRLWCSLSNFHFATWSLNHLKWPRSEQIGHLQTQLVCSVRGNTESKILGREIIFFLETNFLFALLAEEKLVVKCATSPQRSVGMYRQQTVHTLGGIGYLSQPPRQDKHRTRNERKKQGYNAPHRMFRKIKFGCNCCCSTLPIAVASMCPRPSLAAGEDGARSVCEGGVCLRVCS